MQIDVQGAIDQEQAAFIEQTLASALHGARVEFSEFKTTNQNGGGASDGGSEGMT